MFTCRPSFSHRSVRYFLNHDPEGGHHDDPDDPKKRGVDHKNTDAAQYADKMIRDLNGKINVGLLDLSKQDQLAANPEGQKALSQMQGLQGQMELFMGANTDPTTGQMQPGAMRDFKKMFTDLHDAYEIVQGILHGSSAKGAEAQIAKPTEGDTGNFFDKQLANMRLAEEQRHRDRARYIQVQGDATVGSANPSVGEFVKGEMDSAFSIEFP